MTDINFVTSVEAFSLDKYKILSHNEGSRLRMSNSLLALPQQGLNCMIDCMVFNAILNSISVVTAAASAPVCAFQKFSLIGWKTLWETEKMLITSNFSFSHNIFTSHVYQGH